MSRDSTRVEPRPSGLYYSRVGRGSRAPFGRRLASRGLSEYSCHAHPVCREHKAVSYLLLLLLIPCSQRLYNMPAAANATPRCPVRSMTQGASMGVGGTPWPLTRPLLPHLVSRPHGLYFKHCWAGRQPELQICLTEYFNVRPLVRGRRWLPRVSTRARQQQRTLGRHVRLPCRTQVWRR